MNPPLPPNPFPEEESQPPAGDETFYAYALNLEGTQRPGVVDILVESLSWQDAVVACQEFCSYVYNFNTARGLGDTFGRGAIHLFYQLQTTVPCSVAVRTYDYTVGITTDLSHLDWFTDDGPDLVKGG